MTWTNRTMIVPSAHADLARTLCAALAGPGGAGMFTTPLSATGAEPASHFISAGLIQQEFADLLPHTLTAADLGEVTREGRPDLIVALASEAGVTVTYDEVQALLNAIDVTDSDPHARMATLGLQLIQEQHGND